MNRIKFVDMSKGLAIVAMLLGHALPNSKIDVFVNLWHMPLFFILSGYCFKRVYLVDSESFFVSRIKGIMIPYIIISLAFICFHNFFTKLGFYNSIYDFKDFIRAAFSVFFFLDANELLCGPYWFLKQLLLSSILFYFLNITTFKQKYIFSILLLATFYYQFYLSKFNGISNIYYNTPFFTLYMQIGYYLRCHDINFNLNKKVIVIGIISIFVSFAFLKCSILSCDLIKKFPYLVSSSFITYAIIAIVNNYSNKKCIVNDLFSYLGKHTLVVLFFHLLSYKFVTYGLVYINDLPANKLLTYPCLSYYSYKGWWAIYLLSGLIFPIALEFCFARIKSIIIKNNG